MEKTLSMRDAFTDMLYSLYTSDSSDFETSTELAILLEGLYNDALVPSLARWKNEVIRLFMWELLLLSVAFFRFYDDYDALTSLLTYPYMNKTGYTQSNAEGFHMFGTRSGLLEDEYRLDYIMDENNPKVRPICMAAYELCEYRTIEATT